VSLDKMGGGCVTMIIQLGGLFCEARLVFAWRRVHLQIVLLGGRREIAWN